MRAWTSPDSGLGAPGDPVRVLFEALAPGALNDLDARAELSVAAWIWPGLDGLTASGDLLPAPESFVEARSAGLRRDRDGLHIDYRAEVKAPILGIQDGDTVREFRLAVRGDRLWHVRVAAGDRVLVPRSARLVFGHANRHDTLVLQSGDRDADLIVLGRVFRRPFFWRTRLEITAGLLEADGDDIAGAAESDDRIVLRRKDGRHDLLARLVRAADPSFVDLADADDALTITLGPRTACDAIRVRIETALGAIEEGAEALARNPVDAPLPRGVTVAANPDSGQIVVRIRHVPGRPPALASFLVRPSGTEDFVPLRDADGACFAVGLDGDLRRPDLASLLRLARFLAEPAPVVLGGQLEAALGPHYAAALDAVGVSRMAGTVKPVVALGRAGGTPRHDLIGVAPWIFQSALFAFIGLDAASGLAALGMMSAVAPPDRMPDPRADHPLELWLDQLGADLNPPKGLDAAALRHGFSVLRHRLRETELRLLLGGGPDAATATRIASVHVESLGRLRDFDHAGGGDDRAARLAAVLERFARACALKEADDFLARLAFRTGFTARECGRVLTLILRAGVEIFAYFRILWHHAALKMDAVR